MTDQAWPLQGVSSMAVRAMLSGLAAQYERATGRKVALVSIGGVDAARRVRAGEVFDFVVLADSVIERLAAEGHVISGSRVDVALSSMAAAVPCGAAHPDIASEAALRETLLRTARIGYSTGPSGDHLLRLIERWDLAETLRPRLVQAPPGVAVGALIARGEAELGFQQLSELIELPGIAIIGPLPPGAQAITPFAAAVCTASRHAQPARDFLAFMGSREADGLKRAYGMEPA
jgi:molybdate transport system substrate-binding protein